MRSVKAAESAFGLCAMALGVAVFLGSFQIPIGFSYDPVGPRLLPQIIGIGLTVFGSIALISALLSSSKESLPNLDLGPVALITVGFLIEIAFIETLGWVPVATTLFVLTARAFGDARYATNFAIGLVMSSIVLFAFTYGLGLKLPFGLLSTILPRP